MTAKHLMSIVDLETGSTVANAVILSIGITTIDALTFEKVSELYINVNPYCKSNQFRTWDNETRGWWLQQDKKAVNEAMSVSGTATLKEALKQVSDYMALLSKTGELYVFGNGSEFDVSIMSNAYEQQELNQPWKVSNAQSIRTIVWLARIYFDVDFKASTPFKGLKHHALDDSKHEAEYCAKTLNYIKLIADKHKLEKRV